MKKEKMTFKNIKDILSRDEMKMIMAGSDNGPACGSCADRQGSYACSGINCACPSPTGNACV